MRIPLAFGLAVAVSHLTTPAVASDPRDAVAAEALFQEGRADLEAGELDAACPKLAESLRLDPATGTLLALAACHEKQGRLATAWAEFSEAAGRAAHEGSEERRQLANTRAEQLKPRLSWLTVRVSDAASLVPGLTIARSGRPLGRGEWNVPLPVDGGSYAVTVSAPGRVTLRLSVQVADEGVRAVVDVPTPAVEPRKEPVPPPRNVSPSPASPPARGLSRLEWLGIGTGGVGVVTLGVGGYFVTRLLSKKAEADPNCWGSNNRQCTPEGAADLNEAAHFGRLATGFGIAGGALLATGTGLFLLGRSKQAEAPRLTATLNANAAALHVTGTF